MKKYGRCSGRVKLNAFLHLFSKFLEMNADTDTHTHTYIYAFPHIFTLVIYRHLSINRYINNSTKKEKNQIEK